MQVMIFFLEFYTVITNLKKIKLLKIEHLHYYQNKLFITKITETVKFTIVIEIHGTLLWFCLVREKVATSLKPQSNAFKLRYYTSKL